MAIRSKRGLRSIFARKYSNLDKPIKVVDADYEDYESGCAFDRIIVCKSTDQEESKDDDDDDDYLALTEKAAIAAVRDASALTDLIALRLSKANCTSVQFQEEKEEEPLAEVVKAETEEVPVVEATVVDAATEPKTETEETPAEENKGFVETNKELVVVAFEACIESGKDTMTSAEESSQAAIVQRLPLSPLLEQASERLEAIMAQVVEEAQEFFWDHWNMLQNCAAVTSSKFQKSPCGSIQNVISENPTPKTTIEVQVETSE